VADSARDLGVVIDSCLTMADHVSAIRQSGYFQLRQLRPVARSLTVDAAKTIVHAVIACRLDYCNSLLHGFTDSLFRRLQSVQNAAARLITGTRRQDHITLVLRDLNWLPVRRRVDYKQALLVISHCTAWRRLTLLTIASWPPRTSFAAVCVRRRGHVHRPEDPYPFWRPEFFRCRPPDLEQLAAGTATARH